jgi:membrane fusion protein, multidrug efflux system
MLRISRVVVLVVLSVAGMSLPSCSRTAPAKDQSAGSGRPPVAVTAVSAAPSNWTESVEVVGSLAPKFSADIKSEVSGTVAAVYVTEWVPVHKGGELARLDTSETEAGIDALKAVVAQARVAEARASRERDRAVQLRNYGLITPQAFDDAVSALEAASAATASANAQVRAAETRLAKSLIKAPMDGVVAQRRINVGDRVENVGGGDPMFRIVDNRLLDLTVSVPTSRLAGIKIGQRLEFSTDAIPGRTFSGSVMFVNPAIDEASRSAKVIAEVHNDDGLLRGGLFVQGRIVTADRQSVLQVPRDALLNWNVANGTAEVFVVRNEQAEKRTVRTGAASEATVEIASGLNAGDRVVTRGSFALQGGDRVTVDAGAGPGA